MGCLELNAALACSTVTEPIRQESRRLAGDFPPSCACRTTVLAQILTTQRPNRPSLAALAGLARCKPWSWRGGVDQMPVGPRSRRRAVIRSLASGVVIVAPGQSRMASCWV